MRGDWRLSGAFPALARWPLRSAWRMAGLVGREPREPSQALLHWLEARFASVFPASSAQERTVWARAHIRMLAWEMLDAMAFGRLGTWNGPAVTLTGLEHVGQLLEQRRGFILVLNHFDRLLTAPIALARRGITTHVLTMPVLDNADLSGPQRGFLLRKIANYTAVTGGSWRSTDEGLRPVVEGLRAGQGWVILADAWRPEFGRLRAHRFLGGTLELPTGVERIAASSGAALLQAVTYSQGPCALQVQIEPLPPEPRQAVDAAIDRLERDVRAHPWAWWQWGVWDQMWSPASRGEVRDG